MDVRDYLIVARMTNDCPNCGNSSIEDGEGTLEVNDNIFKRSCKCGFQFEYDVNKGTSKKKVKLAIDAAIQQIQ